MTELECDVLVIGSGAAGMSAAITARLEGLDVLIAEKADFYGGSTARSGGMIWAPCNDISVSDGIPDSPANALEYIRAEAGNFFEQSRAQAYLDNAPRMLRTFAAQTSEMRFIRSDVVGDNHPHLPGAMEEGRTVTVPPFDGRRLGSRIKGLAPPLPDLTFVGMQIQPGREMAHFFRALASVQSFVFVVRKLASHARDLLFHGRTMRLVNGNALAARLAKSAFDLGIPLWLRAPAIRLIFENGEVGGAIVDRAGKTVTVRSRRGVVLACGGFPHDPVRRLTLSPVGTLGGGAYALGPDGNVGEGLSLGEAVGGVVEDRLPNTISWTPVSLVPHGKKRGLFPHGFDRNRSGVIAVTARGRRFVSETEVGNDFIRAMAQECGTAPVEGFLIADRRVMRKYGLGVVRPWPVPHFPHLASGYLMKGDTIGALAEKAGIDVKALEQTIAEFNRNARQGVDPDFGRGTRALERRNGDPEIEPNPCLAPVSAPPFYAIKIFPGDFSTLAGLRSDEHARVIDTDGIAVPRLYVAGNDSNTMFGGNSAAGGATLGPALTFGFIAARHLASLDPLENLPTGPNT